ncbi:MAG: hypothetical protein KGS72_28100 [Cyanobacteria bacterium REEB67]|nr:hypothetical protein [Cyanobacteria bacterium REEB67]
MEGLFEGTSWECADIGQFMIDEYLPEHLSPYLEFELEDVVADAKAIFEDINYDVATTREDHNGITINVKGTYDGYSLDDDVDESSIIDMEITIYLRRCAGLISFARNICRRKTSARRGNRS